MKKVFKIILYVLIGLFILGFIANLTENKPVKSTAFSTATDSTHATLPVDKENTSWAYSDEYDKINSKKIFYAQTDAKELLHFDFPYSGGSTATICLRNRNGKNDAILMVSKGQFIAGMDGQVLKVKFDQNPPVSIATSAANDGDPKVLFINSSGSFISKLKKAKTVVIEAEFFQSGLRQMEFDVANLIWNH